MATRDLTKIYIKKRNDELSKMARRYHMALSTNHIQTGHNSINYSTHINNNNEVKNSLINNNEIIDNDDGIKDTLPPQWVDSVDQVNADILKIKQKKDQLSKLHAQRLMVRFDDVKESQDEEEIEILTQEITSIFRHAEKLLQKLSVNNNMNNNQSVVDIKTRQNVQRALATQLQSLSMEFRKSQKEYLTRVKNQKQSNPSEFDFLSQPIKKSHLEQSNLYEGELSDSQIFEMELAEDLIHTRDQEIQQIAHSIEELAIIFKELAVLVIDQGTILDRIDFNMEQVVETTEKGMEELVKAETIQSNSRPMKCIGILLLLICLMTTILLLKHIH